MMTSDRERSRVRRGHAWAREAQDFAPRHAHHSLSPLFRLFFLLLATIEPRLLFLLRLLSLPPLLYPVHPVPARFPPFSLRFCRPLHVILRDWPVSCRAERCPWKLHDRGALSGGQAERRNAACFASASLLHADDLDQDPFWIPWTDALGVIEVSIGRDSARAEAKALGISTRRLEYFDRLYMWIGSSIHGAVLPGNLDDDVDMEFRTKG